MKIETKDMVDFDLFELKRRLQSDEFGDTLSVEDLKNIVKKYCSNGKEKYGEEYVELFHGQILKNTDSEILDDEIFKIFRNRFFIFDNEKNIIQARAVQNANFTNIEGGNENTQEALPTVTKIFDFVNTDYKKIKSLFEDSKTNTDIIEEFLMKFSPNQINKKEDKIFFDMLKERVTMLEDMGYAKSYMDLLFQRFLVTEDLSIDNVQIKMIEV